MASQESAKNSDLEPHTPEGVAAAKKEKKDFMIVRAFWEFIGGIHRVVIPSKTEMATSRQGRRVIENDPNPELWRWAAGGTLVIVHCKDRSVAVLLQRDMGAPSYPGAWTMGSGLSSPDDDLSDPTRIAVREGFEEIRIAVQPKKNRRGVPKNRDSGIVQPVFGDAALDNTTAYATSGSEMDMSHPDVPDIFNTRMDFERERKVRVGASFYKAHGEETLEVTHADGSRPTTSQSGTVAVDPKTRGIDFLKVVEVDLSEYYLDEVTFFDGEVGEGGKPLNRTVGCLEVHRTKNSAGSTQSLALGSRFVRAQKGGKDIDHTQLKVESVTPTLLKMFESVNGVSLDPEKLRAFLNGVVHADSRHSAPLTLNRLTQFVLASLPRLKR
jgi:predicted NUDIX family NTP pyrophosphohydrolase